ncbi:hypothetical protein [Ornithinibacillus sp. JPR2-1]|uniref:hypothetical protein n=1 Tax=Ornithinibacillus sp. JPR2-1 TaxID=2094019 RepID=UPI0031E48688
MEPDFDILRIKIDQRFTEVNQNISESENRVRQEIDSLGVRLVHQLQSTSGDAEYDLFEMPRVEPEEVE